MRPKLQKRSALKFAGRIIPRAKPSGEQSRISGVEKKQKNYNGRYAVASVMPLRVPRWRGIKGVDVFI